MFWKSKRSKSFYNTSSDTYYPNTIKVEEGSDTRGYPTHTSSPPYESYAPATPPPNRTVPMTGSPGYYGRSASLTPTAMRSWSSGATTSSQSPGGVIIQATSVPINGVVHPGSRVPAYVVYHGSNNRHGVFFSWGPRHNQNVPYAAAITSGIDDAVYKGFRDTDMAQRYYQEALDTGVIDILNTARLSSEECYIVTKGVQPGVYFQRGSMMKYGLQWRGGEVTVMVGTPAAAKELFRRWEYQGLVEMVQSDVEEVDI
ncbi:hypothetical protein PQX77_018924 [Marasmius sp. AFHP31]|nr:hypothetical protein PQX77_018924 [Marasmius sp. AFHP31]